MLASFVRLIVVTVEADRQQAGAASVGGEAEVADAYEAAREQMLQKAPQEFVNGQRHQLLLVVMRGIEKAEGDVAVFERNENETAQTRRSSWGAMLGSPRIALDSGEDSIRRLDTGHHYRLYFVQCKLSCLKTLSTFTCVTSLSP